MLGVSWYKKVLGTLLNRFYHLFFLLIYLRISARFLRHFGRISVFKASYTTPCSLGNVLASSIEQKANTEIFEESLLPLLSVRLSRFSLIFFLIVLSIHYVFVTLLFFKKSNPPLIIQIAFSSNKSCVLLWDILSAEFWLRNIWLYKKYLYTEDYLI